MGIHKVVQKSISKNHSTSSKNLDNGRKITDQPQLNNHCIVTADWADASAKGRCSEKQQTHPENPEQPSKIIRRAQVAHGLVDKKKFITANGNAQRRQIHTEYSKQPSKITREEQTGHDSADTKRNINTDGMGKVQTERIKRSSKTPSMLRKDASEKNLPIDRPGKPLSATFAQKPIQNPLTVVDQKGVKTSKNALASAFNLTSASNQNVSRNHGTPRASVSWENRGCC